MCGIRFVVFCVLFYVLLVPAQSVGGNASCICVPYYQCSDESGNVLTDGSNLADLRHQHGECPGYFDVCCNFPRDTEDLTERPQPERGCGYQNSGFFSWSAALFHQASPKNPSVYKCGASLIHPQVVITAAHCINVINQGKWSVRAGNFERPVQKLILHPKYSPVTLQHDLALLILEDPVKLSVKLNTVCIPPPGTAFNQGTCIVSSWHNDTASGTNRLKMLKLPIVQKDKCAIALRTTRLGMFFQLHPSFLCAGGEANKDMCSGDGGSPLVCSIASQPGRYHQAGIVSWGIGCGKSDIPGVYVNLKLFRDWIDDAMITNGFDVNSYRY